MSRTVITLKNGGANITSTHFMIIVLNSVTQLCCDEISLS